MYVYVFYCLCKKKLSVMETLAFASFHGNSETFHLQGCETADPCILKARYDIVVNFNLNFVWICLNAVCILIAKRLKWQQNIAIALQRQNAT